MINDAVIIESINGLIINAPELAKLKYSGVHDINDTYRIHVNDFLPRFILCTDYINKLYELVQSHFIDNVIFDPATLWLVIYKD